MTARFVGWTKRNLEMPPDASVRKRLAEQARYLTALFPYSELIFFNYNYAAC
jgi:hypothetical protein